MSALRSIEMSKLSPETQAAIKAGTDIIAELVLAHDDLVILVAYMAAEGYTSNDIAYAVEKPWKHADVLADAKAALAGVTL